MSLLIKFLVFGIVGLFVELVVKAIKNAILKKDWSLSAEISLWMILLYGLIVLIFPVVRYKVYGFGTVIRGISYMIVFFFIQLSVGWILNRFKICPWSYSGKLAFANGVISFAYAPVWFVVGLGIEKFYPVINRMVSSLY